MSITVNYKGEQIAQSTGNALTLSTAGKYMEADVILSATGGSGIVPFLPASAEKVLETSGIINVKNDTNFDNVTPTTTSQTIRAAGADGSLFLLQNCDFNNYEYIPVWVAMSKYAYIESVSGYVPVGFHHLEFSTVSRYTSEYVIGEGSAVQINAPALYTYSHIYKNASGAYYIYSSNSYGIQFGLPVFGTTGAVATSTTLRGNFPSVTLRCANTYATPESMQKIDSENTNLYYQCTVYRVPIGDGIMHNLKKNILE